MYIVKDEDSLLSISKNKLGCHTKYSDLIRMNSIGKHNYLSWTKPKIF